MAHMELIQSGKNFKIYKAGEQKLIKIENVRFSYPHFGEAREEEREDGSKKKAWQGVAMLPKATHGAAKEAFAKLLHELMDANKVKIPSEYRCLKDGDEKEDEAMNGHWLISFSESGKHRPSARTVRNEVIGEAVEVDNLFYGGCWGSVMLRPWYFSGKAKNSTKTYPKRICCGYSGVQFLRDDKPFGTGRVDDSDAWGNEAKDDDEGGEDDL